MSGLPQEGRSQRATTDDGYGDLLAMPVHPFEELDLFAESELQPFQCAYTKLIGCRACLLVFDASLKDGPAVTE